MRAAEVEAITLWLTPDVEQDLLQEIRRGERLARARGLSEQVGYLVV